MEDNDLFVCALCGEEWYEDQVLRMSREIDGVSDDDFHAGKGCPTCVTKAYEEARDFGILVDFTDDDDADDYLYAYEDYYYD